MLFADSEGISATNAFILAALALVLNWLTTMYGHWINARKLDKTTEKLDKNTEITESAAKVTVDSTVAVAHKADAAVVKADAAVTKAEEAVTNNKKELGEIKENVVAVKENVVTVSKALNGEGLRSHEEGYAKGLIEGSKILTLVNANTERINVIDGRLDSFAGRLTHLEENTDTMLKMLRIMQPVPTAPAVERIQERM